METTVEIQASGGDATENHIADPETMVLSLFSLQLVCQKCRIRVMNQRKRHEKESVNRYADVDAFLILNLVVKYKEQKTEASNERGT